MMKRAWSRKNMWERMPRALRHGIGRVLALLPPEMILGARFRAALRFARHAERWTRDRAVEYQTQRLREICAIAARTPYYEEIFRKARIQPDSVTPNSLSERLPFCDRNVVRDNLDRMLTVSPRNANVDYVSTGGSSGNPVWFYIGPERSAIEYAYLVASWERAGFRLGSPLITLRAEVVAPDADGLRHDYDPILRRHAYSNFHTTDADWESYRNHIATLGPCFLHAYPSSALAFVRFLRRSGKPVPRNIRGVLVGSENVYPDVRAMTETVLGCQYSSWYGHSEKLVLAAECEDCSDYHVWPTYGYCELVDDNGRTIREPGQRGEIVGTGFINRVTPMLRYRTGDFATYVGESCEACGRQQTILREIRGHRTHEVLIASDGSEFSWVSLNMHDDTFESVRQFQFLQETPGRALLRVVPTSAFRPELEKRIILSLQRKMEGRIEVQIQRVERIDLSPRGKAIYVDQRLPIGHARRTEVLTK